MVRRPRWLAAAIILALAGPAAAQRDEPAHAAARARMVEDVARMARDTARATGREALAPSVMGALGRVPRHRFVPSALAPRAYENNPLPIGQGQTISQPYIVALSTDLIEPKAGDVVLEVGTGSGYQAAVLARLAREVFTIEIKPVLQARSARLLAGLGVTGVTAVAGDGYHGIPSAAPFDAIMITAAVDHIPPPLVKQLKEGGRLVLPLGSPFGYQNLVLVTKRGDDVSVRQIIGVLFVPMTGHAMQKGRP